jgi:hypothetical protein
MAFPQEKKKTPPPEDMVTKIQKASAAENERKRKEAEAKKKGVSAEPSPGVFSRMYEMVMGSSEKKKK